MFKHLIQISHKSLNRTLVNNKLGLRFNSTMQGFQDRRKILEDASKGTILGADRENFLSSRQLPDFDTEHIQSSYNMNMDLTEAQMKEKHPLEWIAEPLRINENPYLKMNEKSLLITNFPKGANVTKRYLRDLCMKYDSSAVVNKIYLSNAQVGENFSTRNGVAYAIVEFEMQKQVSTVRRGLRKHWEQDKLIKVKTLKDANTEMHSERTIVLSNIPSHMRSDDLATAMSKFGAITSIESPTVDSFIGSQLEQKGLLNDVYSKERQLKKEQEYRYAQVVLNDTLTFDKQFEDLLKESWGEEKGMEIINKQKDVGAQFTKVNLLDEEKLSTFMRVMAQLQAEGIQVESAKTTLGSLAKEIENQAEGVPSMKKSHDDLVIEKKQSIETTLKYLLNNKESLDTNQQSFLDKFVKDGQTNGQIDPIHKLQRMSLGELTNGYDLLLGILKQREELVKNRLKESLKHFGREEKILFESADYRREQETMPDILRKLYDHDPSEIDRILGLNEQIQTVNIKKNLSPHEKLYQWLTSSSDFKSEMNWNKQALAYANTYDLDNEREVFIPDVRMTKSDVASYGKAPSPFHAEYLQRIQEEVEKFRDEMDTPFDEIYHKERKLVQDIVRAKQSIKDIEANLPNPAANRLFDSKDIDEDPVYGDMYGQGETQFQRDQKLAEKMNNANLSKFKDQMGDAKHQYNEIEKQTIEELIASGQIDRSAFEEGKAAKLANRQVSLGYAFITFSHADEAKQALMILDGEFFLDQALVSVMPKGKLDHSELDKSYFMKKMRNESKLVDQRSELREARKNLRDFESNIDQELPSLKRLKDFKSIAQELIENPKGKTRRHVSGRRTKRETEELYEKLKDYQKENPNIDVTSLFENDKIDGIRRELHKRSFQSFKKFEFLKAGIEDKKSEPKRDLFEPFNYPPLEKTVGSVLTDGINGRVNISGLPINNPGRRFDYTEQEFLEAYLGKDFSRKIDLNENEDNHIFGFQDSLKSMFPDKNKYLKMPKLKAEQQRLEDFMGLKYEDGKAKDQKFADYLKVADANAWHQGLLKAMDHQNQDDPKRSKLRDLEKQLALLQQRVEKSGTTQYLRKDVQKILQKIEAEYENHLVKDTHGQLHEAFEKEVSNDWEPFAEQYEAGLEEQEKQYDSEEDVLWYREQLTEKMKAYDTEGFKFEDFLKEHLDNTSDDRDNRRPRQDDREQRQPRQRREQEQDQDQDHYQDQDKDQDKEKYDTQEDTFEDKSAFDPVDEKSEFIRSLRVPAKERVKFTEELDDTNEFSIGKDRFGSKEMYKKSNENLYNLQHVTKKNRMDRLDVSQKRLRELATAATSFKRAIFDKVKSDQLALPVDQRVPHYLDANGMPKPYALEDYEDDQVYNVLNQDAQNVIMEMTVADYLTQYKELAPIGDQLVKNDGEIYRYAQTYMDEKEVADYKFRQNQSNKGISEFARDEEDIYDIYKMKSKNLNEKSQFDQIRDKLMNQKDKYKKMQDIHDEANQNLVDTPTLDKYFSAESKGVSAVDNFQGLDFERQQVDEEFERIMEAEDDETSYRKELMARMFGGKLTSRQFGVLMNMPQNLQDKERMERRGEFRDEQNAKDAIRNAEEIVESFRRSQVLNGEWGEDESHNRMQMRMDEIHAQFPTKTTIDIAKREEKKQIVNLNSLRNSEQLMRREYYFDEGLGQSLNEHTADLKQKYPDITVQTRRDRDGLPLVRIMMKPKYKYNLDEILSMDPQEMQKIQNENQEALLQEFMPEDKKDFLYKVAEENYANGSPSDYLTQDQSEKLKALFTQRFHGKFKDDLEGFKDQLKLIKKMPKGPAAMMPSVGNPHTPNGRAAADNLAFDELSRDQKIFDYEINLQLALKIKDKNSFQLREKSDFIKFSRSETTVFRDQITTLGDSLEILEKDNEWLLNAGTSLEKGQEVDGYFDEAKFKQLKSEIKRKREAKERVIQQGFPEFKPYLRL